MVFTFNFMVISACFLTDGQWTDAGPGHNLSQHTYYKLETLPFYIYQVFSLLFPFND